MEHLHHALDDDNHIEMLLYEMTCFMIKNNQNILMFTIRFIQNSKRFSEPNSLSRKKNPFKPVCFLYIDSLIITVPVVN